jgi:hypothetical protein
MLAMQEVDEFTLDIPALENTVFNSETGVGTTTITVKPYISDMTFMLNMFAHTSTFRGGANTFSINTSAASSSNGENAFSMVANPNTGETDGEFLYDIEMPAGETMYCFNLSPTQDDPVAIGDTASVNGSGCMVSVDQLVFAGIATSAKNLIVKVIEKSKGEGVKHSVEILNGGKPEKSHFSNNTTISEKNIDCSKVGTYVESTLPGATANAKYNVKIDQTEFEDRIVVLAFNDIDISFDKLELRPGMGARRTETVTVTIHPIGTPGTFSLDNPRATIDRENSNLNETQSLVITGVTPTPLGKEKDTHLVVKVGNKIALIPITIVAPASFKEVGAKTNKPFLVPPASVRWEVKVSVVVLDTFGVRLSSAWDGSSIDEKIDTSDWVGLPGVLKNGSIIDPVAVTNDFRVPLLAQRVIDGDSLWTVTSDTSPVQKLRIHDDNFPGGLQDLGQVTREIIFDGQNISLEVKIK